MLRIHVSKPSGRESKEDKIIFQHDFSDVPESVEQLNQFRFKMYRKQKSKGGKEILFMAPNEFLKSLSVDDQREIFGGFIKMKSEIISYMSTDDNEVKRQHIQPLLSALSSVVSDVDSKIHLASKLMTFQSDTFQIYMSNDIGKRFQDKPETTFHENEIRDMMCMSIMAKLFCPIFSDFYCVVNSFVDPTIIKVYCATILSDFYLKHFYESRNKLWNYMGINTESNLNTDASINRIVGSGSTNINVQLTAFSNVIARVFVLNDLYSTDKNSFVSKIYETTKYREELKSKSHFNAKFDVSSSPMNDEGNRSIIEQESRISEASSNEPILSKRSVLYLVDKKKEELQLIESDYNEAVEFYLGNHPEHSLFTNSLLITKYGRDICGAESLDYIDYRTYVKLLVLLQYDLIKDDYNHILHLCSASGFDNVLRTPDEFPYEIFSSFESCSSFIEAYGKFPKISREFDLFSCIKEVLFSLNRELYYNTAPVFWEIMGEEDKNMDTIEYGIGFDKNLGVDLCRIINQSHA